jgi:carbamoyltransferase
VLITSFNVAGEPIVNTPSEALRCFQGAGLDALFMGPFLLRKAHVRSKPPPKTMQAAEVPK